jgi:hypothetical protein
MIKRTLYKVAKSFERLSFTEEGVFIRSYRLGQSMAGLPTKYPGLFLKEIELGKLLMGGQAGYPYEKQYRRHLFACSREG